MNSTSTVLIINIYFRVGDDELKTDRLFKQPHSMIDQVSLEQISLILSQKLTKLLMYTKLRSETGNEFTQLQYPVEIRTFEPRSIVQGRIKYILFHHLLKISLDLQHL